MNLKALILLLFPLISAQADDQPTLIEIGAGAGVTAIVRSGVATGAGAAAGAATMTPDLSGEFEFALTSAVTDLYLRVGPAYSAGTMGGANPLYEATIRGNVMGWIQLQELMVRRNEPDLYFIRRNQLQMGIPGNSALAQVGVGPTLELGDGFGEIGLSLGMAYARYQFFEKENSIQHGTTVGAYAGAQVHVKFWRIENELYASYIVATSSTRTTPNTSFGSKAFDPGEGFGGFNIDENLYLEAIRLPFGSLGPELRMRLLQMPQGEEFTARLGVKFKTEL